MYQENEFDKLENIDGIADDMRCLAHMIEIVGHSCETVDMTGLAGILNVMACKVSCESWQAVKLLHAKGN
ncbi:hypothetical protein A6046_05170 [[Haemophilus] ducreyi]|uniref:hypothetical protein n=1 Tax=Haemophilus ducreyi TaxID=730 RepID=UPI0007CDEB3F|nr:hypothetical protein [[Haemophilus] ducreyi]ANF73467.1 hypothetical protein A6045_03095 [[Haemophilus] ducreyi]ANF75404.1 hypothetical protein A6046_05170 [[Haemophilus] ducreyi]